MKFRAYRDLRDPALLAHRGFSGLPQDLRDDMFVVSQVFPFQVNSHVVENLINWDDQADAVRRFTFPSKEMLTAAEFEDVRSALLRDDYDALHQSVTRIRLSLNPHPGGQLTRNVPRSATEQEIPGLQHKYQRTVLFFPRAGQTCHAYCSFCFRWPQFVGMPELRIESPEVGPLIGYLREHTEVRDVLFTGGDPLVMRSNVLRQQVDAILAARLEHIQTIRFGTKALSYWPYRFTTDDDADGLLDVFRAVIATGRHVAVMAHFNHPSELRSPETREAIRRVRATGAEIRTQTPMLRGVNDSAAVLADLWSEQVRQGCIPYYLFAARDTGAQRFFGVPLEESHQIYSEALRLSGGLVGTVRGPVMSADPGKVLVLGPTQVRGEEVLALQFLQARNPLWTGQIFYASRSKSALWIDELTPAFGAQDFFFSNQF